MSLSAPSAAPVYRPCRPEETVLYRVLQEHLETFIERTESGGRELPAFVKKELRGYLECGILAHGFARYHCHRCGHDRLVPFSCGGRGFCPSCTGRRMANQAAHLVDRVIPPVPVRQWVLSLPYDVRALVAFDAALRRAVLGVLLRVVFGWLRGAARRRGIRDPQCGSVTYVQRYGSDLRINLHFHSLVLDGVYSTDEGGEPTFHPLPAPTDEELEQLANEVRKRVARLFRRRGLAPPHGSEAGTEEPPLLLELGAASAAGTVAQGPRAGARIPPVDPLGSLAFVPGSDRIAGEAGGFNLHARVAVKAHDRAGLERLCRYLARPPIATRSARAPPGRWGALLVQAGVEERHDVRGLRAAGAHRAARAVDPAAPHAPLALSRRAGTARPAPPANRAADSGPR